MWLHEAMLSHEAGPALGWCRARWCSLCTERCEKKGLGAEPCVWSSFLGVKLVTIFQAFWSLIRLTEIGKLIALKQCCRNSSSHLLWNFLFFSFYFTEVLLIYNVLIAAIQHRSLRKTFLSLLLFFGTLHSDGYIFPFLVWFLLLFFSQLFVRPPQTTILHFFFLGAVKNLPASAGHQSSIPGSGRSPGEGSGNPLQYSCLGNPMDRGDPGGLYSVESQKSQTWHST